MSEEPVLRYIADVVDRRGCVSKYLQSLLADKALTVRSEGHELHTNAIVIDQKLICKPP